MADDKSSDPSNNKSNNDKSNGNKLNNKHSDSPPKRLTPKNSAAKNSGSKPHNSEKKDQQTTPATKPVSETIEKTSPAELFNAKPMPKMSSKKIKNNWLVPSLVTLLVIIALLASGWSVYQQHLFKQNWLAQQTKIDTQISRQSQVIEQAKNSGQASMQATSQTQLQLNQLAAKTQQFNDSLYSTQEKIKALSGRQKQDWMLAEAAYLIKIAQLQLSLQKDKVTAIQLLKTADSRIIEIADNSLLPIREAIAKDLSDLSLIIQADVTGIALALNAINQQIPDLSLLALEFQPIEESLENNSIENEGFDLDKIYQNFLTDFVVIKDHSEPVKPLMTADQRINLNSNIQLAIQQAQIALVQANPTLYRLNIDNAIQWTNDFFKHDDKAKQVIEQLNNLKTKPIEIHYPAKLHAQKALDEISQQQLYHWLDSSLIAPVNNIDNNNIDNNKKIDSNPKPILDDNKTDPQQEPAHLSDPLEQDEQQNQEVKP